MHLTRRAFLASVTFSMAGLSERAADAALARGITLDELVRASRRAIVGVALEAHCEWATFGKQRVIVTDTRVRVEETLLGAPAEGHEVLVRVLGGRIGELGERVSGQAELVLGTPALVFLGAETATPSLIVGAAQGHYRIEADAERALRLWPSPHLPRLLRPETAAVSRLRGRTVSEAKELLRACVR